MTTKLLSHALQKKKKKVFSIVLDRACTLIQGRLICEALSVWDHSCSTTYQSKIHMSSNLALNCAVYPSNCLMKYSGISNILCVASRGKGKKGLVFVYAFAEVGIWLMPSSRTVSHDVFHLFGLCANDKRFVAALILNVKPLKQMPERLLEGAQVCSIAHPARQPKKLIIKFLLVTHKNQYPWIGWLIAPNMSSCA